MYRWLHTLAALTLLLAAGSAVADPGLDTRPANSTCVAPPRPGIGSDVGMTFQKVFPFLTLTNDAQAPMVLRQSPAHPSIWYFVERGGLILRLDDAAKTQSTFLDIRNKVQVNVNDGNDEGGILGMALHPAFESNGVIYVYYTAALAGFACNVTVSRFQSTDGGLTINPNTETVLFTLPKQTTHHHGGTLEFGNDGMLYVSIGDDLQFLPAEDPNSMLGKILRLDVDVGGGVPYGIPADNPFASGGGLGEVWALGFRNPYRFTIDHTTGELWVGDVGRDLYEEVDKVQKGGNYGWPFWEGLFCAISPDCHSINKIDPIFVYDHSSPPCSAIIGGYVYRGSAFPELAGRYVYSDYCHFDVRALFGDAPSPIYSVTIGQTAGAFKSLAEDIDGELYALRTREVDKLVRSTTPPAPFPQHLSQTGCVDAADATKPAAGMIPYTVNAPLWSDGAAKDRWMALPDGTTIAVQADGDFNFPIGSVLMKQFKFGGVPIETRLFVRHDDGGWAGYSYEWNAAGTDADLLADSKDKWIGNQTWHYPSRSECLACHTEIAGFTLGPTTGQLNGDFYYAATGRTANQLETLDHIGLLDSPPDISKKISVWEGSLDKRARSYLQANCAHCHAPGGTAQASIDFRFATPLAQTHLCGATPGHGDLGVPGALILTPGDPSKSVMSLRVHDLGANRMPPLATSLVDPFGAGLIDAWIRSWVPANDGSCVTECSDGIDNDGDGKIDFPDDPGCESANSAKENPRCDDGIDNDGDGKIDWDGGPGAGTPDPECVGRPFADGERKAACGIGAELVLVLTALRWGFTRRGHRTA